MPCLGFVSVPRRIGPASVVLDLDIKFGRQWYFESDPQDHLIRLSFFTQSSLADVSGLKISKAIVELDQQEIRFAFCMLPSVYLWL